MKNKLIKSMSLFGILGVIGLTSCTNTNQGGGITNTTNVGISFKNEKLSTVSYHLLTSEDLLNIDSSVTNKEVTYKIEDTSIARIEDGGILGLKTGKTKITVTPSDTSLKSDTLELEVVDTVLLISEEGYGIRNYTHTGGNLRLEGPDIEYNEKADYYKIRNTTGKTKTNVTLTEIPWKSDKDMPEKYKGFTKNSDIFFVEDFKAYGYKTNKEFCELYYEDIRYFKGEYKATQTGPYSAEVEKLSEVNNGCQGTISLINPKGYYDYFKKGLKVPAEHFINYIEFSLYTK